MEKNVTVSILLDIYGKVLTEKQRDVLDLYFNEILSLSEIAEEVGITRQAVHDCISKGENKLFNLEEKLGIMKKTESQEKQLQKILSELSKIQVKNSDEQINNIIKNVVRELNCLV
jgi:hypothetical protein